MSDGTRGGLLRAIGFWGIVAFGVGDILGAGIYALVGKIAGVAGTQAWLAFGVSLFVASFTAFSYAEWSGRIPRSGGEAAFCRAAVRSDWAPLLVGWMVLFSGMVSMATVSRAAAGYVDAFVAGIPLPVVVVVFLLVLTAINLRGIRHSSIANIICTAIEIVGLGIVLVAAVRFVAGGQGAGAAAAAATPDVSLGDLLRGGALAFFAFIGFEDMVNVAEEVEDPRRNLPRAILLALLIAGSIYMVIAALAVRVVPPEELAASGAPLLEVVRRGAPAVPDGLFTAIAIFAVANTALLNYVMGSRLLYGLARLRLLPQVLARVHPVRRTPGVAIGVMFCLVLVMALGGRIVSLSGTTSTLLLLVFFAVNASLVVVKRRRPITEGFRVPLAVPAVGAVVSLALVAFMPRRSQVAAAVIVGAGLLIVGWRAWRRRTGRLRTVTFGRGGDGA